MRYLNPYRNKQVFSDLLRSPYVVDKTGIISALVPFIGVENRFVCVTRPRRFGKTVNANTIACFLGRGWTRRRCSPVLRSHRIRAPWLIWAPTT